MCKHSNVLFSLTSPHHTLEVNDQAISSLLFYSINHNKTSQLLSWAISFCTVKTPNQFGSFRVMLEQTNRQTYINSKNVFRFRHIDTIHLSIILKIRQCRGTSSLQFYNSIYKYKYILINIMNFLET